jgi:hypothetical protein
MRQKVSVTWGFEATARTPNRRGQQNQDKAHERRAGLRGNAVGLNSACVAKVFSREKTERDER